MSEPRRLLDDAGSDLELALLRSALEDQPPPRSRRRALAALGLEGRLDGASAAVSTTTAASMTLAAASQLMVLKWISVGLVGGILALGTLNDATRADRELEPATLAAASDEPPMRAGEAAVLDNAREALAGGDPSRALQALETQERQFPTAALRPEAMALRIEVTLAHGDRAGAIHLAHAFLGAHPRSAQASKVRAMLAAAQATP